MNYKLVESSDIRIDFKCSKDGSAKFSEMFEYLEANKGLYNIATYGFGDTNLEDVFLSVSKLNQHHNDNNDVEFEVESTKVTGIAAFFYHFTALIIKR